MPLAIKTGTITTATSVVSMGITGTDVVCVAISGTHSGISIIIEGSINSVWYPINSTNAKNNNPEFGTFVLGANISRTYYVIPGLYDNIRVRASAYTSGTLNVQIGQAPGVFSEVATGRKYVTENTGKQTAFLAAGTTGANTVLVSSGPGILHRLIVTTAGATAGMIVYDNATTNSGTILYTSAATHALGTYELNLRFSNGVTVRKAATTAAACFVYSLS